MRATQPFVARPNPTGLAAEDWDERVADLQYRDCFECAVGHGVATRAIVGSDGDCREVTTEWVPTAERGEGRAARRSPGVELSMEALAGDGGGRTR